MTGNADKQLSCEIVNEFSQVKVRKIFTDQGERLEIRSDNGCIRLDAVALEALAWQEADKMANIIGISSSSLPPEEEIDSISESQDEKFECEIVNEFSRVRARKIAANQGDYLDIRTSDGQNISLNTTTLKALTRQEIDMFSDFLETSPRGPTQDFPEELKTGYSRL